MECGEIQLLSWNIYFRGGENPILIFATLFSNRRKAMQKVRHESLKNSGIRCIPEENKIYDEKKTEE